MKSVPPQPRSNQARLPPEWFHPVTAPISHWSRAVGTPPPGPRPERQTPLLASFVVGEVSARLGAHQQLASRGRSCDWSIEARQDGRATLIGAAVAPPPLLSLSCSFSLSPHPLLSSLSLLSPLLPQHPAAEFKRRT